MRGEKTWKRNTSSQSLLLHNNEFASLSRIGSLIVIIAVFNKWPLEDEVGSY